MAITTVLFDLDGTLLPMDQDVFIKAYFGGIAAKLAPQGYDPQLLVQTIWRGTGAMIKNDGTRTNEEAFWTVAEAVYGDRIRRDKHFFDEFYEEEFDQIRTVCGYAPDAARTVYALKEKGLRVALATNPIFPARATQWRIAWAGLRPEDFALYTTYENSRHCKPNLDYYRDVLAQLQVCPEECLMVGNDVDEDMIARELGMEVFLLTDCLINKSAANLSAFPHGGFAALNDYLDRIL